MKHKSHRTSESWNRESPLLDAVRGVVVELDRLVAKCENSQPESRDEEYELAAMSAAYCDAADILVGAIAGVVE